MMKARPGPRSGNQGARMPRTSRTWGTAAMAAGFAAALGFAVPAAAGPTLDKVKQGGALSCGVPTGVPGFAQPDTTTALNLADYFRGNKMEFKPVVIEKIDEVYAAFFSGRCDVMTGDGSALAAQRIGRAPNPEDYVVLTDRISKEPLAPVVRHGDEEWHDVVDWVVYAMMEAEEKGITQKNVDEMAKSDSPDIKRMLGATPGMGKALNLDEKWAYNAVKLVGNYGEIFDKHLGLGSPLKLERGYNNLWSKGGLIYAMPIR